MSEYVFFVLGGLAFAFILGWRARGVFERASRTNDALTDSIARDAAVSDEALLQDESEVLPYREPAGSQSPLFDDEGWLR